MKVLESFLIALGIKVDDKSFQKADAAFGGLTKSALQFGAVLASKLAIDKVVGDFKNIGTELNNFNKLTGLSTQNVQSLGQAIKAQGGSASDAFADLKKMQDLMASPITGNVGWMGEVAKLGLNPDAIIGAKDTAEAMANIAKEFEHMTPLNQRMAGESLGFSDATIRLMMRGGAEVERQLDSRGKLGVMTQQQIDDSARLTKATSELDLVFTDMGNTIAGELAPAFADMAEDFVTFYRSNKDLIDSGLKEFFGGLANNIELVSVAMALMGGGAALKGLAALRALIGLSGAGAAAGAAAAAGGASMLAVAGGSAAALFYSSKLNEGEDTELLNNRLKKGGGDAVGATVDFFMQKGWTREQAEGLAANIEQESGFQHDASGDGGNAYGLAQWHPDRQADFAKFSGKNIRQATGVEQLEFMNHELTRGREKAAGDKLREATTSREAGSIVSRYYERPGLTDEARDQEASNRGSRAESYSGRSASVEHRNAPSSYDASSIVAPAASTPAASAPEAASRGNGPASTYTDNRTYHINGADTEKVKQVLNEQLGKLTEKTMQDFKSPEL